MSAELWVALVLTTHADDIEPVCSFAVFERRLDAVVHAETPYSDDADAEPLEQIARQDGAVWFWQHDPAGVTTRALVRRFEPGWVYGPWDLAQGPWPFEA